MIFSYIFPVYCLLCHFATILVDLHSRYLINASFCNYHLLVAYIETHIFIPNFSFIFFYFIFFYFLLILRHIFNFHLQQYKTCNQHHIFTLLKKYPVFHTFFTLPYADPTQYTNKRRCSNIISLRSRVCLH